MVLSNIKPFLTLSMNLILSKSAKHTILICKLSTTYTSRSIRYAHFPLLNKCRIKASGSPQGDYNQKETKEDKRVNTINIKDVFSFRVTVDFGESENYFLLL